MTPAEVLAAAADKLDVLVTEASDGPWEVGSNKDMLNPGGPSWFLDGIERWRGLTNNVQLGEDEGTARYIAAMNPLVGKALADLLRAHAEVAATLEQMLTPEGPPTGHVYELARLIIGGES